MCAQRAFQCVSQRRLIHAKITLVIWHVERRIGKHARICLHPLLHKRTSFRGMFCEDNAAIDWVVSRARRYTYMVNVFKTGRRILQAKHIRIHKKAIACKGFRPVFKLVVIPIKSLSTRPQFWRRWNPANVQRKATIFTPGINEHLKQAFVPCVSTIEFQDKTTHTLKRPRTVVLRLACYVVFPAIRALVNAFWAIRQALRFAQTVQYRLRLLFIVAFLFARHLKCPIPSPRLRLIASPLAGSQIPAGPVRLR